MDKELLEAIQGAVQETIREALDTANRRLQDKPQDTMEATAAGRPESRLEVIERAVSGLGRRLSGVEAMIDSLEPRIGRLDGRFAGLESDLSETRAAIRELRHLRPAESIRNGETPDGPTALDRLIQKHLGRRLSKTA
jgi:chromosome segregation ATPase